MDYRHTAVSCLVVLSAGLAMQILVGGQWLQMAAIASTTIAAVFIAYALRRLLGRPYGLVALLVMLTASAAYVHHDEIPRTGLPVGTLSIMR